MNVSGWERRFDYDLGHRWLDRDARPCLSERRRMAPYKLIAVGPMLQVRPRSSSVAAGAADQRIVGTALPLARATSSGSCFFLGAGNEP